MYVYTNSLPCLWNYLNNIGSISSSGGIQRRFHTDAGQHWRRASPPFHDEEGRNTAEVSDEKQRRSAADAGLRTCRFNASSHVVCPGLGFCGCGDARSHLPRQCFGPSHRPNDAARPVAHKNWPNTQQPSRWPVHVRTHGRLGWRRHGRPGRDHALREHYTAVAHPLHYLRTQPDHLRFRLWGQPDCFAQDDFRNLRLNR